LTEKNEKTKDNGHDACVRVVANELKKANWTVKADIAGYDKPAEVNKGYIPDIQAEKKGCVTRICEIATPEMFDGNMEKYIEFKNYCNEYDFHMYVVDKDGKRTRIDPQTLVK
jgi:hypothetical protein